MSRRRLLVLGLVLLLLVAVVAAVGSGGRGGRALDPRSTTPDGTRAILDVLREFGVTVTLGDAPGQGDVALVIEDRLGQAQTRALDEWVREGGVLVLTDPLSSFAPPVAGTADVGFTEPTISPECDDPAVSGVERVAVDQARVFREVPGAVMCFPRAGGWWMVREPRGAGQVVSLGGAYSLSNDLIDNADTAVLAVALLTPQDGGGLVVVEPDTPVVEGEETLFDLLPLGVQVLVVQIPLAWLALLWWRGRRDGPLVDEDPPLALDAADQVVAHGRLLQRARLRADTAQVLRAEVEERLAVRGVTADVDPDLLEGLRTDPPPEDDAALVAHAQRVSAALSQLDSPPHTPPHTARRSSP